MRALLIPRDLRQGDGLLRSGGVCLRAFFLELGDDALQRVLLHDALLQGGAGSHLRLGDGARLRADLYGDLAAHLQIFEQGGEELARGGVLLAELVVNVVAGGGICLGGRVEVGRGAVVEGEAPGVLRGVVGAGQEAAVLQLLATLLEGT
ncbi:MAG: hypothetical protein ACO1TE_13970 [Prosthecobacter sp.]